MNTRATSWRGRLFALFQSVLLIVASVLALPCSALDLPPPPGISSWQDLEHSLPSWPVANIGPEIDPKLIAFWESDKVSWKCPRNGSRYPAFPSKYGKDWPDGCDSNDMNLFNGLLCASGVEESCQAVVEAQDAKTGEWYKDPLQRAYARDECVTDRRALGSDVCHQCNNTFSPDAALGTMLYVAKKTDQERLKKWFDRIEEIAKTTRLCNDKGECSAPTPWARICSNDHGCKATDSSGKDQSETVGYVSGFTTGQCLMIPNKDTSEYADVSAGEHVSLPLYIDQAVNHGAMLTYLVLGPGPLDRNLVYSQFSSTNFPLHLEATRLFLKMVLRNPSLATSKLPDVPSPDQLINLPDGSSWANPESIHAAAVAISQRQSWNPYYSLLAWGPTPAVHDAIINLCPTTGQPVDQKGPNQEPLWRWETDDPTQRDLQHSMGWDCVFVARTYNLMRVQESWRDSALRWLDQHADPIAISLRVHEALLNRAQQTLEASSEICTASRKTIADARTYADQEYPRIKAAAQTARADAQKALPGLLQQTASARKAAQDAAFKLAGYGCQTVTPPAPPAPPAPPCVFGICPPVPPAPPAPPAQEVPPGCHAVLSQLQAVANQANQLAGQADAAVAAANKAILDANAQIAEAAATRTKMLADSTSRVVEDGITKHCSVLHKLQAAATAAQVADEKVARANQHLQDDKRYLIEKAPGPDNQ